MRAVHWAALRARASGADLRVVHAFRWRSYPLDYGVGELGDPGGRDAAQAVCESAVDLATAVAPGSRLSGTLVCGPAGAAVVRAAAGAGLLVLGGSHLGAWRTLLGAATLPHVMSRTGCDVAVVPARRPEPGVALLRITVGLAGGPRDACALAEALRFAHAEGCAIHMVVAAGAENAAAARLRAVRQELPISAVDRTTAYGPLAAALGRLTASSAAVVCDRSTVELASGLWRSRAGRQMLNEARCPSC